MNVTRSILLRTGYSAVILTLLLLLPAGSAHARALPAEQPHASAVQTRFEGYLKAIGASKWLIGSQSVLVDSSTRLIEKRGKAEIGAWVIVWGTLFDNDSFKADIIYVDRPAGRAGPIRQFSGIISKQVPGVWIIDELLIKITAQTQIIGTPGAGWLVWVVAQNDGDGFTGLVVEAIAGTPEDLPVEFEGVIEAIAEDKWRVDGRDVFISPATLILGTPTVNWLAEVQATRDASGRLHAHIIRVVGPSTHDAALGAAAPLPVTAAGPSPADDTGLAAASATSPASAPVAIASGFPNTARPALAYDAYRVAHALWEAKGQIYYASQELGQGWSPAKRIATGLAPTIKADKAGRLHALFYNEFFGNYDVYYLSLTDGTWSLPINIARTGGASFHPTLAIDQAGVLRAAWMDSTPGYWTIYTGYYDGTFWRNYPVPNARGQLPSLAAALDGTLYLAWQDAVLTLSGDAGASAIYLSQYTAGSWTLPVNISDSAKLEATNVSVTATSDSMAQLTWIAGDSVVMYCYGRDRYWPVPQIIFWAPKSVHTPRIITERGKMLHVAWDEGDIIRTVTAAPAPPAWPEPEIVTAPARSAQESAGTDNLALKDVTLTENPTGGVIIGWADTSLPDNAAVYALTQESNLTPRVWLPALMLAHLPTAP